MTALLFSHRAFRRFALAFVVSRAGDYLLSVGMIVFVFAQTGSAAWVAAAAILRVIPNIAFSAWGGALGSRFGLRLLVLSDVLRAGLNLALTGAALAGSLPAVLLLSVCSQVAGAGYAATSAGLIPRLVAEDEHASANATVSAIESVSLLAGPSIAGVLLSFSSPAFAFGLNAVSFALSAAVIARLRLRPAQVEPARGMDEPLSELTRGWAFRYLWQEREIRMATVGLLASNFLVGVVSVLFVLLSIRMGSGDSGAGYLMAAFGGGGLLGALFGERALAWLPVVRIAVGALVISGLAAALLGHAELPWCGWLLVGAIGAASAVLEILAVTHVQAVARGSTAAVCGALDSLGHGAVLFGLLTAPVLVALAGVSGCLLLVAIALVASCAALMPSGRRVPRVAGPLRAALR